MCQPLCNINAAALTLPSIAKPSENTWSSSFAFSACSIEASLLSAMLILMGDLPILDGSLATVRSFSVLFASGLNYLTSWCRGPLCLSFSLVCSPVTNDLVQQMILGKCHYSS